MKERYAVQPRWRQEDRGWDLDLGAGTVVTSKIINEGEMVAVQFDRHREAVEINTSQHTLKPIISASNRRRRSLGPEGIGWAPS